MASSQFDFTTVDLDGRLVGAVHRKFYKYALIDLADNFLSISSTNLNTQSHRQTEMKKKRKGRGERLMGLDYWLDIYDSLLVNQTVSRY